MRVLLTGASGFLGHHVLTALKDIEVVATSRRPPANDDRRGVRWVGADLTDHAALPALMRDARPTHLLHMAWRPVHGDIAHSPENLAWIDTSLAVAEAFIEAGGGRIVMAGTCSEYGFSDEDCVEDVTPLTPHTRYGACKNALRAAMADLCAAHGVSLAWPRIFPTYGPGENENRFVTAVIRALLEGRLAEMSSGDQVRDYMYAGDIGEAVRALLTSDHAGEFNIGSGVAVTLDEIANAIADQTGGRDRLRPGARPDRPYEPRRMVASIDKATRTLAWRPRTTLEQGVERTIAAVQARG